MGLDQFFFGVRENSLVDVNENNELYYFRRNQSLHWDLEKYFDTEISNCEYFILSLDELEEMVKQDCFYCLRKLIEIMKEEKVKRVAYHPWW